MDDLENDLAVSLLDGPFDVRLYEGRTEGDKIL